MEGDPDTQNIVGQIIILLILTMVNAFFAGAEMAVVSVNKNKIKTLADKGNKKAALIQKLFDDSTKFLSTIQVAITFAGFFSSASAATGISQVLGNQLRTIGVPYGDSVAFFAVTLILSYFTLVFGELVPKRIALQKAEVFSLMTVQPIYFVSRILSPFIKLLSFSTNIVLKLTGMKTENLDEAVSEEEIKALLESGHFKKGEKDMINSVFSFTEKTAREAMIPRIDVFMIDLQEPFTDYIDEVLECRHSRIPVYHEHKDNIIGILQIKDYILEARKTSFEDVDIKKIMQKPYFVPETKSTDELLKELQKMKQHMALLIDEYGSFSGIVTVEDLVEEIVGDINDEYDDAEAEILVLGENLYLIDGGMQVDDLNQALDIKLVTENYDTVSGFLIEQLGYIPTIDDRSMIEVDNLRFKINEVENKRIHKIILEVMPFDVQEEASDS